MQIDEYAFTIEEAASVCRVHHSRIREMMRHATRPIGHKPIYFIRLSVREIVALIVARELVCAGYAAGKALDMALGVVADYTEPPRYDHRAVFPLAGAMGATSVGANALTGQVGTKIVVDIAALWAAVTARCGELYETPQ